MRTPDSTKSNERDLYSSQVAVEIDRLVVGGYTAAVTSIHVPASLDGLAPYPAALLHTVAFALLAAPMTYEDLTRIVPYTPADILKSVVDNSVADGVLEAGPPGLLNLTPAGRGYAEGIVELHERTVEMTWSAHLGEVEDLVPLAADVVRRASGLPPPIEPATFPLFAALDDRPTPASRLVRLITALRYWRADAHRGALADADLNPPQAHALNRLWDEHRGVERIGQNYPLPSADGVALLEERGLAAGEKITSAGLELRQKVEAATDLHSNRLYEELIASCRHQRFLEGLVALPV